MLLSTIARGALVDLHYSRSSLACRQCTVEVAISAYSSLKHYFYLALQTNCPAGLCNQLITVSTTNSNVVANVTVQPAIELLVVDGLQNLFVWGATSKYAAELGTNEQN